MILNYLKIAWRNLLKNKVYSTINILGLSIGLTTSMLIALYVVHNLSYDTYHSKADRIALFQQFQNSSSSGSSFAEVLNKRSGIEAVTQINPSRALVSKLNFSAYESNFCMVDSNLTKFFEFPLVAGTLEQAINLPNKLVLSERMAAKYFADKNPIGQTLEVQLSNKSLFTVVGVMKNIPENTHLKIDFLASTKNILPLTNNDIKSYWDYAGMTYLLLNEKNGFKRISSQLCDIQKATKDANAKAWSLGIIPLKDIYLKNRTDDRIKATNAIEYVRIFSAVAICILLLACFNYLNLSLARATLRAKEVGVRKVVGAERKQLIYQFWGESFLFNSIAMVIALLLLQLSIPYFNNFSELIISFSLFSNPLHILYVLLFLFFISLFTGFYPALVLSAFKPILVLKNYLAPSSSLSFLRRGLVIFQFSISIIILVSTLLIMNQLQYLQNKDLGYKRDQILTLKVPDRGNLSNKNTLFTEISNLPEVQNVTRVSILPGNGIGFNKLSPQSVTKDQTDLTIGQLYVDDKFLDVFKVKLLEGRFFSKNNLADNNNYIVNKEAIKKFGWKIGQTIGYIKYEFSPVGSYKEVPVNGQIIGIVENYHQMDLKSPIFPIMMIAGDGWSQYAVKLNQKNYKKIIAKISTIWKNQFASYPFEYSFLDDDFNKTYQKEQRTSSIFGIFSGLALFITCLGLFGLVTFMIEQRTKEIGIRKVLGASANSIVALLSKDFIALIAISMLIATPLAYYFMEKWLSDFAYKTDISWWLFLVAGLVLSFIAFLTIGLQALKAAFVNPVRSLRTE